MFRKLVTLIIILSISTSFAIGKTLSENNPKAKEEACVIHGNARFTMLTSKLIRMEWSANGVFEDRATLAFINRNTDVPAFTVKKSNKGITIKTDDLTLYYTGNEKFSAENLKVEFYMPDYSGEKAKRIKRTWTPGMDDSANLMGTLRTLDGCKGFEEPTGRDDEYEKGILSRDGWALIDDSANHLLVKDDSDWGNWVDTRDNAERQDYYLFAYGHEYKEALYDFTKVAGKIPLPPKYVFGYWWSRFWQYSHTEFVDLAKQIRSYDIPIDVMVIDMDWHDIFTLRKKDPPRDEYGQRIGWTGYTWQKKLFPSPENFLDEIHSLGLRTSLNLHPASGIQPYEESYDRFVKDYLSRTNEYDGPKDYINEDGKKAPVAFRIEDRAWTDAYFNSVLHPLEKMGVDFWWLDWQQWKESKYMPGLSNTFWLNYTFYNDKVRRSVKMGNKAPRPLIYHRWGGLGSHRYQIGFSGDTYDDWAVLQFIPYFTSTSSNVGYGYWGHDIGGHTQQRAHSTDPELYTRWLQNGVFTPIFKTHSSKSRFIERRFWMFPEYFNVMRDAIKLRYILSPYIYTAARQAYDTGISMCRPLYYDSPEADEAYTYNEAYMFGNDILATVLCEPRDSVTALTKREMWFPEGNAWYDMSTGAMYKGGSKHTLYYTIDENPYYIKAGAVIPTTTANVASLQEKNNELCLVVAPGEGNHETFVYEDDGETQAYESEYAFTKITKSRVANKLNLTVAAREGKYNNMDSHRKVKLVFEGVYAPESLTVNGVKAEYCRLAEYEKEIDAPIWSYNGSSLAVTLYIPESEASEAIDIECIWPDGNDEALLYGKKGILTRMQKITPEVKQNFYAYVDGYAVLPDAFLNMAQCASYITEDPYNAANYILKLSAKAMEEVLNTYPTLPAIFKTRLNAHATTF